MIYNAIYEANQENANFLKKILDNTNSIGFLELALNTRVSAAQLGSLIDTIDGMYYAIFMLEKAEESSVSTSESYRLTKEEILYIDYLQIGTPNHIRFRGISRYLLPVLAFVLTVGLATTKEETELIIAYLNLATTSVALSQVNQSSSKQKNDEHTELETNPEYPKNTVVKVETNLPPEIVTVNIGYKAARHPIRGYTEKLFNSQKISENKKKEMNGMEEVYFKALTKLVPSTATFPVYTIKTNLQH